MTKIMLAGDTHGDIKSFDYLINEAIDFNANIIIVLGDFGHWEPHDDGAMYKNLNSMLQAANIKLYWIDGNHEHHSHLREKYINPYYLLRYLFPNEHISELVPIRSNIFHIPRGATFKVDGITFLGMGGAFSIDRGTRKIGHNFFWEEEITDEEITYALTKSNIDILLSHDVPVFVNLKIPFWEQFGTLFREFDDSLRNRTKLQKLVDAIKPDHIFHGHYHLKYKTRIDGIDIIGLNCNGSKGQQYLIIECKDGKIFI